jgi:hypothetical protein
VLRVGRSGLECSAHNASALYRESFVVHVGWPHTRPSENTFGERAEDGAVCVDE